MSNVSAIKGALNAMTKKAPKIIVTCITMSRIMIQVSVSLGNSKLPQKDCPDRMEKTHKQKDN